LTPVYHITDIANLPGIVSNRGLHCDNKVGVKLAPVSIGYSTLKERRARTPVPICESRVLADYVPFYFCTRSPMLYAVQSGSVEQYQNGQNGIIYLVSTAESIAAAGLDYCFTDGHAVEAFSAFFNDLKNLSEIDWNVINSWSWGNRDEDNDRKRRKQAEFLVYNFFPWDMVDTIGVIDASMQAQVQTIISSLPKKPIVTIHKDWYY